jgi:DNA-nicking Smr family endonuclease
MPKKTKISQADIDSFYQAIKGVKPLVQKKIHLAPTPKSPQQRIKNQAVKEDFFQFSENSTLEPVSAETRLSYKHVSVSHHIFNHLRKGHYPIDASLDLHGSTIANAKIELNHFLKNCIAKNDRVLLLIHGKGRNSPFPILKNKLNHWLRETDTILAFCSALPVHGGQGAVYVLLRSNTPNHLRTK